MSLEQQLRDFYGEDEYEQRKAAAQAKLNAKEKLPLREDIDLHPEEYDCGDYVIPRKVQLVYRDLIWCCVDRMKDGDFYGLLTIDNIIINGGGRYSIRETANGTPRKYLTLKQYPESLYNLSTALHPRENIYPAEFENFLYLLQRVNNNVNLLRKLYYHPALLTAEERGLLIYNAYGKFAKMQKTPKETLSKLAKALNHMSIEPTRPSKEQTTDASAQSNQRISEEDDELFQMYVKVYDTYHNDYPKNGKGFVCYYKDVLQHLNEKIDIYNAEVETRWREAEVEAVNKATADAANNSKDAKKGKGYESCSRCARKKKECHWFL